MTSQLARMLFLCFCFAATSPDAAAPDGLTPGSRVLLDAHNCYPYDGRWADRIERALTTGTPLAIEQDLAWYRDPQTGAGRSIVTHGKPFTGAEPTLRTYFLERIRPIVERALREDRRDTWPLITLNLDFKDNEPPHLEAVWDLLGEYESWLSTAERTASPTEIAPIRVGPVLVLTGDPAEQEREFSERVPAGGTLRLFGAVARGTTVKTNYRRWSNNPWSVVEPEGQPKAGPWTTEDEGRLTSAVRGAHAAGLWIRFYTLNGHAPADSTLYGWSESYNFGSLSAATERWRAAIRAGADFIAVDQYEDFAKVLHAGK